MFRKYNSLFFNQSSTAIPNIYLSNTLQYRLAIPSSDTPRYTLSSTECSFTYNGFLIDMIGSDFTPIDVNHLNYKLKGFSWLNGRRASVFICKFIFFKVSWNIVARVCLSLNDMFSLSTTVWIAPCTTLPHACDLDTFISTNIFYSFIFHFFMNSIYFPTIEDKLNWH